MLKKELELQVQSLENTVKILESQLSGTKKTLTELQSVATPTLKEINKKATKAHQEEIADIKSKYNTDLIRAKDRWTQVNNDFQLEKNNVKQKQLENMNLRHRLQNREIHMNSLAEMSKLKLLFKSSEQILNFLKTGDFDQ